MVHSRRDLVLLASLIALGTLGFARESAAQAIYPGAQRQPLVPRQPQLSPYLNLLRNDNSLLNPYHSFVLPRRDMQQQQFRMATEINRLEQTSLGQFAPRSATTTNRLPTGNAGRFQTYLHFYSVTERRQ